MVEDRLLVVGDSMLDRYWEGSVERISPEAPVPVLRMGREWHRPGGAANVALNLAAMQRRVALATVLGQDVSGAGDTVLWPRWPLRWRTGGPWTMRWCWPIARPRCPWGSSALPRSRRPRSAWTARLLFFGNGGSACDAQHIAAELTGRLAAERRPLPALSFNADTAALTAIANDYGYSEVFARLIEAQGRPGDCAIAISTSGRSPNVLRGLQAAKATGLCTVGLLGRDGGAAADLCDVAVVVSHVDSARVQEAHIFIGHTWCGQIESALGLA
jgi:phosphoheptose isomerase